jgi:D-lactate dehydrogenase (cytochrome)
VTRPINRVAATPPNPGGVAIETDPDIIARYLEDAAHYPGGHAPGVARPRDVDEVAAIVRSARRVLPVGARSSLTGGATPAGELVVSTEHLTRIRIGTDTVIAGAGVTLQALQQELALHGTWLPAVPTFLGATVGGAVSTNAAGAATFKYGSVRNWVHALTVVLATGGILRIERDQVRASHDGRFVIETGDGGELVIAVPDITMPDVPKRSAGYYAAPCMDLVDLFIGAEGTLGVIVEAELRTSPRPAGACWVLVPVASEWQAIALVADLRGERGLGVAAIEHIDRRSLDVIREDGVDRRLNIAISADSQVLLLAQVEIDAEASFEMLAARLSRHVSLDTTEVALPSNPRRGEAFVELREAVPSGVNRRVGLAHASDSRIHKTAADMIVPFNEFGDMMRTCRRLCAEHNLDLAVWGHISDGNVHPNIIPRDYHDVVRGQQVLLELARQVIAMGGCPLAEHGVGRNPVKQQMLEMLYGRAGVAAMRGVKLSLDPDWKFSPGVLFQQTDA